MKGVAAPTFYKLKFIIINTRPIWPQFVEIFLWGLIITFKKIRHDMVYSE